MNYLKIADAKIIGAILFALGYFSTLHSARVNAQKHLNNLVALGHLVRGDGFYRIPECQSEYGEHARLLTACLAQILSIKDLTTTIHREVSVPIGFRADAVVLCEKDGKGICFVLEVAHNETHDYLRRKVDAYKKWKEAKAFLTQLFNKPIRGYGFVCSGKEVSGATPFNRLLTMLGG